MNKKEIIVGSIVGIALLKILHNQKVIDRHIYETQSYDVYGGRIYECDLIEKNTIEGKLKDFIYKHFCKKGDKK